MIDVVEKPADYGMPGVDEATRMVVAVRQPVALPHRHTGVADTPVTADCIESGALYIAEQLLGKGLEQLLEMHMDCIVEFEDL